ncbi:MAG: methyl-accepting chemotaxis protein, partial [Pseudomonadota bacterium]|nr:methyl-accepting chemotaxis protein [Pseudomonadota bacterium]
MNDEISSLRQRGIVWLTMAGWTVSGAFVLMALFTGIYGWQALIASVAINLPPSLVALQKRHDATARLVVGLMIAAQPALLLYATRGIEWQIDMHMYFFVALASLTVLCDLRPIIAGALLIAAHHLLLALVAPSWVFAGGGGIPRVLIHALAVVLQAGILGTIAVSLTATLRRSASAREEAQQALESTRAERALREQLEHDLNERRRTELVEIGQAFETSVSRVATALADTALTLDETTGQLDTVARDTGSGAAGAAQAAAAASHAVATVADHIASLSASIGNIAVTVSQQDTLASEADGRSQSGGVSVEQLVGHSTDIAHATRAIAEVADHTNMLALNATIEAAAAGE